MPENTEKYAVNQISTYSEESEESIHKQKIFDSKINAVQYIMNDILNTHHINMSVEDSEDTDSHYYVYEKDGHLWFRAYDHEDVPLDLKTFESLNDLKEFIASYNVLELPSMRESYQLIKLSTDMQKYYYVNGTDHINWLYYQNKYRNIEDAIKYILYDVMNVQDSSSDSRINTDNTDFVVEYNGNLYNLLGSDPIDKQCKSKYNMLFDERVNPNMPKNFTELRQWFRDLKSCTLNWSDRAPYTVGISVAYG